MKYGRFGEAIFDWWGIEMVLDEDCCKIVKGWTSLVKGNFKKHLWDSVFFAVVWILWYEWNQVKFNNYEFCTSRLISQIKQRVREWVLALQPKFLYSSVQVMKNLEAVCTWDTKAKR